MNEVHLEIGITKVFVKHQKAINAVNDKGERKYRYIIHEGSSRSSKTHSLCQFVHEYANKYSSKRIGVFRDTKKDCRDTIGADFKKEFPALALAPWIDFNKTEAIYSFPNGSAIEINGTDEPNKLHGYNSDVIWVNEPYNMSRDTFDQLDQRCKDFIIIDWNPQEVHWIDDLKKDSRAIVIHSTFRDNPYCPREQRLKILSYQPVKMCDAVESEILSESEAMAYDLVTNPKWLDERQIKELLRCRENQNKNSANTWKWSVYGLGLHAERPNRIFHWHEIPDHEYQAIDATTYYGVDWGVVDPWAIVEGKYYDGCLYLHELNYRSENEWREALDMATLESVNQVEEGLVKHVISQLNVNRKSYILCDTNRPLKVMALQQAGYDYAISAPKPPGSIIDGINIITGLKVYYTASSSNLKTEHENYSRMVDRYGIVLEDPEDKDNHCMDCARYIALFLSVMGVIKK